VAHAADGTRKDRVRGVLAAWIENVSSLQPESLVWPAPGLDRAGRVTKRESIGVVEGSGGEAIEEAAQAVWAR
jgi:hypothetical protein